MAQISRNKLDKVVEEELFNQFWQTLAKLKNAGSCADFFSDILTETEKVMLAKRMAIALLLLRGKSASQIKDAVHVSNSTVSTVASWLKNANPETTRVLISKSSEKDWETVMDGFEALWDKLPPKRRTNWSEAGKDKWERVKIRNQRKRLR